MNHEQHLELFVSRARAMLGDALDAILLYGSAARGEYDAQHSDLNLIVLVTVLNRDTMQRSSRLLHDWLNAGHPQPLFFTRAELRASTDAFPIEILDMLDSHRVLFGVEPLAGLTVNPAHHRAQVEHELRSKLLRLRQKGMLLMGDEKSLLRLAADSLPTFLLLLRHVLLLAAKTPPGNRRALLDFAAAEGLIDKPPFTVLLDLRESRISPRALDSVQLFEDYLKQVERLVLSADTH